MPAGHRDAFDADDLATWSAFATVLEWLPPALDAQLTRDADLTHFEYGILFALDHAQDRSLRMTELAGYANSTLSRLSRAVSRLENRGWVERAPDHRDGRAIRATLTDAGREVCERATPGHERTVRRLVLSALTQRQAHELRTISRRIARAIRDEDGWRPATASKAE